MVRGKDLSLGGGRANGNYLSLKGGVRANLIYPRSGVER